MNLIRKTLENLAKLLNLLFDLRVEAKHFKNAKFNSTEDDAVAIWWTVLNKLADNGGCNIVDNVKLFLHSYQYKSLHFYCLPCDMSEGSRSLLLAFGFLVGKGVLHKYIEENIYKQPEMKNMKNQVFYNLNSKYLKEDEWHAVQWIKGKIDANKRIIEEKNIAIQKFVKELNNGVSKTMGNLSLYEILALGNIDYGKRFTYEIDRNILILEHYEKFIRMERVFWDWMSTVRDMKKQIPVESFEELSRFCNLIRDKECFHRKSLTMITDPCEKLVVELPEASRPSDSSQTKWYEESEFDDGNIAKPSSFKHVTHISWKEGTGLEISTNDKEFAEFFRDAGDRVCLGEGRDVREVIFDYISNSLNFEEDEAEREEDSRLSPIHEEERCKPGNIGKPYNFQHVTHCSFDKSSGFNVVTTDRKLSWFYNKKDIGNKNKK